MNKDIKEIVNKFNKIFKFIYTKKHIKAINIITGKTVTIAKTPSDRRAKKNIIKMLEKACI